MNKRELIKAVADTAGHSQKTVAEVLDNVIDIVRDEVSSGAKISLFGFGSWALVHKPARTARNPSTGAEVKVPERWKPTFTPSPYWTKAATAQQSGGAE